MNKTVSEILKHVAVKITAPPIDTSKISPEVAVYQLKKQNLTLRKELEKWLYETLTKNTLIRDVTKIYHEKMKESKNLKRKLKEVDKAYSKLIKRFLRMKGAFKKLARKKLKRKLK
jgi:hypothetical protein